MAFFDRFTQAVNGNGQNSFWGMSEGAKVNNRIAETQNALRQCYQELGECYYATFRQEEREELRPFVQQITDLLQQMEQLKEEQRSLRGLVACPNCGEDIPKNSVFCPNCGGRAITQDVSRCKNCGCSGSGGRGVLYHLRRADGVHPRHRCSAAAPGTAAGTAPGTTGGAA